MRFLIDHKTIKKIYARRVSLPLAEVLVDNAIRLFTVFTPERVSFAVARTDGTLLAANLTGIEVR